MSLPPCVLWVDPGGMTGLAAYFAVPGQPRQFWADEFAFQETGNHLAEFCRYHRHNLWIGWERFRVGPKTPGQNADEAIEPIGLARYWALSYGCRILTPANSGDRKAATMAMLKLLGWWVPAKDDAQSAAQHMLAWLLREHLLPPREHGILMAARATQGDDDDGPRTALPALRPQRHASVRPPVQGQGQLPD